MIVGIGNDLESIARIKAVVEKQPAFLTMILTPQEIKAAQKRSGKHYYEFVAGRFSAKEAYAKATGFGIGQRVHWHDIEILNGTNGRPEITVINCRERLQVAITHSGDYVNTVVCIEHLTWWQRLWYKIFGKGEGR